MLYKYTTTIQHVTQYVDMWMDSVVCIYRHMLIIIVPAIIIVLII